MMEYLTLEEYGLLRETLGRFAEANKEQIKNHPAEDQLLNSISTKLKDFVKV